MKRIRQWLYTWLCAKWREAIILDVEERLTRDREMHDAVVKDLVTEVNKLREQLNERQSALPANRRVARTFSEFRAAAEGRPQETR